MNSDEQDCVQFWLSAKDKVKQFAKFDDANIVFGASTRGHGHHYQTLPAVTDKEILSFEKKNGIDLPLEYRTFLQTFGAGGAGPYYGIYDFRKNVQPHMFTKPFPYASTVVFADNVGDDTPTWSQDGLAGICEAGCGTDYMLELNGSNPGQVWCIWSEECEIIGSFLEFYREWLEKIDIHLSRYQSLRALQKKHNTLRTLKFSNIVSVMNCAYTEQPHTALHDYIPKGQIWAGFDKTPGTVILNEEREVLKIHFDDISQIS